jgi:dimethylaniline monooxygenase (N-oxide forming)
VLNCIVIGAGPGGLVCTKELLESRIEDVLCLEQSDRIGGVFSTGYDTLQLTSSAPFSMFSDFWIGEGQDNHFWSKDEAVDYWTRYATHYGVMRHIRFESRVARVTHSEQDVWDVCLSSGEILQTRRLAVAVGNNAVPRYPEWKERLAEEMVHHSKEYRNAEPFRGKRVLVVGGGESASDVVLEISQVAAKSWISLRESAGWIVPRKRGDHAADISTHRGIWDLPRDYGKPLSKLVLKLERAHNDPVFDALADLNARVRNPRGIWGIYGTKTLGLPQAIARHGCRVVGDIVEVADGGKRLKTKDGEVLQDLDAVVFCTGYVNRVSFMPKDLQVCDPRSLYKHMFHTRWRDRLAFIGWARPAFGSQFPIMELQSRLCAAVFSGQHQLPDSAELERVASIDRAASLEQFEGTALHIRSLVDYHRFMNGLARVIGCYPRLWRYFFLHPRLWLHLMYGPTQATQFRLSGPGQKVELAHQILEKLPISTFNHVVKAGLRGRLRYALKALWPRFGSQQLRSNELMQSSSRI